MTMSSDRSNRFVNQAPGTCAFDSVRAAIYLTYVRFVYG